MYSYSNRIKLLVTDYIIWLQRLHCATYFFKNAHGFLAKTPSIPNNISRIYSRQ